MKIVQINAVNKLYSTGRICFEFSEFVNTKTDNVCKTFYSYGEPSYNSSKFGTCFEKKFHAFLSRLTGKQGYFSKHATKRLIKKINEIKPDVVHLHNLHANFINLNQLFKYLSEKNIATVVTLHDCWFFTGKCTHYVYCGCEKWKTVCNNCPQLKSDHISWFFDKSEKMFLDKKKYFSSIKNLGIIGVSDWLTGEIKKSFLSNSSHIRRIYNWVDLNVFYPKSVDLHGKYGIENGKFVVLSVRTFWKEDDVVFIDFLKMIYSLDDSYSVLMVGNVSDKIKLPKRVVKTGFVSDVNQLSELYSFADVYVHLSHAETFGKVVAESLACGTPSIVYNNTALPEIVKEGCGFVVPTGSVDDVILKIKTVREQGKEKYSANCVKYVSENFGKEKLINDTLEFYNSILESKE